MYFYLKVLNFFIFILEYNIVSTPKYTHELCLILFEKSTFLCLLTICVRKIIILKNDTSLLEKWKRTVPAE